jgi:hypothetical protein
VDNEPRTNITPEQLTDWTVEWITLVHNPMNTLAEPSKNKFLCDRINQFFNPPTTLAPPKPLGSRLK